MITAQAVETVVAQLADAGLKLALAPAGGLAGELACVLQHISVPQLVRWRGSNPLIELIFNHQLGSTFFGGKVNTEGEVGLLGGRF